MYFAQSIFHHKVLGFKMLIGLYKLSARIINIPSAQIKYSAFYFVDTDRLCLGKSLAASCVCFMERLDNAPSSSLRALGRVQNSSFSVLNAI